MKSFCGCVCQGVVWHNSLINSNRTICTAMPVVLLFHLYYEKEEEEKYLIHHTELVDTHEMHAVSHKSTMTTCTTLRERWQSKWVSNSPWQAIWAFGGLLPSGRALERCCVLALFKFWSATGAWTVRLLNTASIHIIVSQTVHGF